GREKGKRLRRAASSGYNHTSRESGQPIETSKGSGSVDRSERFSSNKRCPGRDVDVNVQLLTPDARGAYLERVQRDIASAEHFVLVTAFATSDGIALLEPAMRRCLDAGGQGTLALALDRQHFNAADVFKKLASLAEAFPNK